MATERLFMPFQQFLDSNGDPLNGGTMTFYQTSTTTKLDTYSDTSLSTANSNPITLDSSGRLPVDVFGKVENYRAILKDSDGNTIFDADPVVDVDTTPAAGVLTKTGDYTVTTADEGKTIAADATSAAFTITLPAASTAGDGFDIFIVKSDSSTNAVTLDGDGSETINGSTTYTLSNQYDAVHLQSDSSEWFVLAQGNAAQKSAIQDNSYTYAAASGTDTLTASLTPSLSSYSDGQSFLIKIANNNTGAATLNIDSLGAISIKKLDDGSFVDLEADDLVSGAINEVIKNGSRFELGGGIGGSSTIAVLSDQSITSSTVTFTDSALAGARRITLVFEDVSPDESRIFITIGDSGGYETSGYKATSMRVSSSASAGSSSTSAFTLEPDVTGDRYSGTVTLVRIAGNRWVQSHSGGRGDATVGYFGGGIKELSAELDRIRIDQSGTGTAFSGSAFGDIGCIVEY